MPWIKWIVAVLLLLAAAGGGFWYWQRYQQQNVPETIEVSRQTVERVVEFKGHIEAEKIVKLGFERSGIVDEVNVGVGDEVAVGAQLAKLDTRATELDVSRAFAARVSRRDAARVGLEAAQAARDATKAENDRLLAQRRQAVRDAKAELDQQKQLHLQTQIEEGTDDATTEAAILALRAKESAYAAAQEDLNTTQKTVDKANRAASDAVAAAQEAYDAVVRASDSVGGLSTLEVNQQQAQVQLEKDTLVAPISGTVTEVEVEPSEVALAGQPLVTIQTTNRKEIMADVDEVDIPFVRFGMEAKVVFDAYPDEEWLAQVVKVDPVGKIEDDDVTYQATLRLREDDERLLPALTARVTIMAGEKTGVVAVPRLALEEEGEDMYIYAKNGPDQVERRRVVAGMVGTNGLVEIVEGLSEGDTVLHRPLED